MKNRMLPTLFKTPLGVVFALGLLIMLVELLIMTVILDPLISKHLSGVYPNLIDSILLILIISPVLYSLVFKRLKSDERLRQINASAQEAIVVVNEEGRITDWNPAAQRNFQYTPEEAIGQPLHHLLAPSHFHTDAARGFADFQKTGKGPLIGILNEVTAIRKDGSEFPVELSVTAFKVKGGWQAVGVMRDISEHKRAKDTLRASEEKFSTIFESNPAMIAIGTTEGTIVDVNQSYADFFGYTRQEMKGKSLAGLGIIGEDELQKLLILGRHASDSLRNVEVSLHTRGGNPVNVLLSAEYVSLGGMPYRLATLQDITARKQAEEALRAREAEFHMLAESMPQIVWIARSDGQNIYFNQQWIEYTGLTLEESLGHGWNKPFHPDDQQRARDAWQHAVKEGGIYSIESRLRRTDGVYRWWLVRGVPVKDTNGDILKWFGTCTDIHDLKMAELAFSNTNAELRESKRRFSDLLENVELISMMLDREARITYCNEYLLRQTGWKREEIIGGNWFDIFAPPELSYLKASFFDTLLANLPEAHHHENEILTRSGERLLVHWDNSVLRSAEGEVIGTASIGEEITERKKLALLLEEKENRLRTLVNTIPDLIWLKDAEGIYQSCNPMFERFFGAREADIVGKSDFDFVDRDLAASFRENDRIAMAADKSSVNEEWVVFADDGHRALLETVKTPMRDAGGELLGVLGIARDITERKAAEDAIRKSNIELSLFRKLIDNSNDAIEVFEPGTMRFLDMNETECRELGYSREELLAMCAYDVDTGFNKDTARQLELQVRQTGSVRFDSIHRRKDCSTFPVEISLKLIEADKPYLLSIARDISERKRLELEKEQYFKFFNLSINPMCIADPFGCFTQVNPAFTKLTGYSASELIAKPFLDFVLPEDRQRTEDEMKLQVEERPTLYFENHYLCKDGSVIELSWMAYYDKQNGITYATAIDATERKRTQKEVRDSREKLHRMLNSMAEGAYGLDANGDCTFVNRAFLQMLGYRNENEVLGKRTHGLIHHSRADGSPYPENECRTYLAFQHDQAINVSDEVFWRKDGVAIPVEYWSHPIESDGGTIGAIVTFIDITERKRMEETLKNMAAKFHTVFELSSDAMMLLDEKGFFECNEATLQLFGFPTRADFISKHPAELSPPTQPGGRDAMILANEHIATAIKNGSNRFEWMHRRSDGTEFLAEVLLTALELDGRQVLQATVRDITERKLAEAALAEQFEELRRWHDVTSGREARILELKHEVNEILGQSGQPMRYPSAESPDKIKE